MTDPRLEAAARAISQIERGTEEDGYVYLAAARAALAAADRGDRVMTDLRLMPDEPSDEMIDDGCTYCWDDDRWVKGGTMTGSYKAMRKLAPKLKPLVWRHHRMFCEAETGLGRVVINISPGENPYIYITKRFNSIEEAKAAAQADYEERVRELFG